MPAVPIRRRLAGWFSIVLFVLAMAGQATHLHGRASAALILQADASSTSPQLISTELTGSDLTADTCPLCVAMNSAQAASAVSAPVHEAGLQMTLASGKARFRASRPGRVYQSRPPPQA